MPGKEVTGTKPGPVAPVPSTTLRVLCRNSAGLLRQMSDVFATHGVNILSMQAATTADLKGVCTFGVCPRNPGQLAQLVGELRRLRDVIEVTPDAPI